MLRGIPVRWRVLSVLFVVSFVNYLLRNVLSVAIPSIRTELDSRPPNSAGSSAASASATRCCRFPAGCSGSATVRAARSATSPSPGACSPGSPASHPD